MTDRHETSVLSLFDFSAPAEIYVGRGTPRRHGLRFKQFDTAAEAILYAVEQPRSADEIAVMECGDKRYSGPEMLDLYDRADFPLPRTAPRARPNRSSISVPVSDGKNRASYREPQVAASSAVEETRIAVQPRHRYKVGARLRMQPGGATVSRQASNCKVTFVLPFEGTQLLYRVKSDIEAFERVVAEADLAPMPAH